MAEHVVDSSVVIALLNQEPGSEAVPELLRNALLSAVNLAEVITKLAEWEFTPEEIADALTQVTCDIVAFDDPMALDAGLLHAVTRGRNISLGDRCCLALAMQTGLPVVTADRAWANLGLDLDIRLLR